MATTLFTPEQRAKVDEIVKNSVNQVLVNLELERPSVEALDPRPAGTWDPADPKDSPENYKFLYVAQGMLEDVIEALQERV